MGKPRVSIVVAVDERGGIGRKDSPSGKLLWYIPEDFKRFKKLTTGHPVIMGRKTFESIVSRLGHPLPERTNIVVTRDPKFSYEEVIASHSLEEAVEAAKEKDREEVFVIGGGQIYEQALPLADRLYVTLVKGNYQADIFFPDYTAFKKVLSEQKEESGRYTYTFMTLER